MDIPGKVTVRQEGEKVLLIVDGRAVSVMPWQAALELSKALLSQGKKAEEYSKAEQIIHDNAILYRSGAPFGLSDNKKIIEETKKETAWNRDLRKYMPKIKSTEILHCPAIINHGVRK